MSLLDILGQLQNGNLKRLRLLFFNEAVRSTAIGSFQKRPLFGIVPVNVLSVKVLPPPHRLDIVVFLHFDHHHNLKRLAQLKLVKTEMVRTPSPTRFGGVKLCGPAHIHIALRTPNGPRHLQLVRLFGQTAQLQLHQKVTSLRFAIGITPNTPHIVENRRHKTWAQNGRRDSGHHIIYHTMKYGANSVKSCPHKI